MLIMSALSALPSLKFDLAVAVFAACLRLCSAPLSQSLTYTSIRAGVTCAHFCTRELAVPVKLQAKHLLSLMNLHCPAASSVAAGMHSKHASGLPKRVKVPVKCTNKA